MPRRSAGQRQPRKRGSNLSNTAAILDVPGAATCKPAALRAADEPLRPRKGVGRACAVSSEFGLLRSSPICRRLTLSPLGVRCPLTGRIDPLAPKRRCHRAQRIAEDRRKARKNARAAPLRRPAKVGRNRQLFGCNENHAARCDQAPQRSAAVCTGASHNSFAWPSSADTVIETPAMSRAVT